jgi:3-isopropylmalate/(R)-2-methylmalate dehydratase small subunit
MISVAMPSSAPFPSGPIRNHRGRGVAVVGADIDTDRIIPARFLKCVTFDDLARGVFADDRSELADAPAGQHPFDRPEHQEASVLVVNSNFGCGSSREHAPQALMRWGIRALIGESFAEIFFGNCLALGLPCLGASHGDVLALQDAIEADPSVPLELDVAGRRVQRSGQEWPLSLADGPHRMLVSGEWDGTSQLVAHDAELRATAARLPYLAGFRG